MPPAPPLLRIPNEIINRILTLILPHEVLHAALSCKFMSELGAPHLKKCKELAQTYDVLYVGTSCAGVDFLEPPILWLDRVVREPCMAYYPRVLQLLEYNDEHDSDDDFAIGGGNRFKGREREEGIARMQEEGLKDLVEACPYLTPDEHCKWTDAIVDKGDDDAALAILLSLLPSLKEVVIWLYHRSLPYTSQMIERIVQTGHNPSPPNTEAYALSKLHSFRLGQRGDNAVDGLSFVVPFFQLPSVSNMAGWFIKGSNHHFPRPTPNSTSKSNIKTLAFEQSIIFPSLFPALLRGIGTNVLRTFFLEVDGGAETPGMEEDQFTPDKIVNALLEYAGKSLEELHFVVNPGGLVVELWEHISSLASFEKLRIVEIEAEFLCRSFDDQDVAEDALPLIEMMPKTLEKLALRHLTLNQAEFLFRGFEEAAAVRRELSALRMIILRHPNHWNNAGAVLEFVRTACEGCGVEVRVESNRGGFPFYEARMGANLVERPAICANYPRKWE